MHNSSHRFGQPTIILQQVSNLPLVPFAEGAASEKLVCFCNVVCDLKAEER
jgi:hypothetical protein